MQLTRPLLLILALTGCPKTDSGTTTATTVDAAPSASTTSVAPPSSDNGVLAPLDNPAPTTSSTAAGGAGVANLHPASVPIPSGKAGALASAVTTAIATATATSTHTPSTNQLQACCSALRQKAQQQSAQAVQYQQAAMLCDGFVAAMANAGTNPQLEQLKPMLQGAQLPPICQF